MGRKARKCSKKCTRHLFVLKPTHYLAFLSFETKCSFCLSYKNQRSALPFFNKDRKYFTSSFILPDNKGQNLIKQENLHKNDQNYRIEYFKSKIENHEQKSEIFCPKPSKKHSFCSICKEQFEDYHQHIISLKHRTLIKESSVNNEILLLCQLFSNNPQNSQKNIQQAATNQLCKNYESNLLKDLNYNQKFKNLIKKINSEEQGWENAINNSFKAQKNSQKNESNESNEYFSQKSIENNNILKSYGNFKLCMGSNYLEKE